MAITEDQKKLLDDIIWFTQACQSSSKLAPEVRSERLNGFIQHAEHAGHPETAAIYRHALKGETENDQACAQAKEKLPELKKAYGAER
jgi:tRNA(Ile2) C34 agmatinyltransferase TiaS